MPTSHISSQLGASAIEVLSLADPQDFQLNIRPDNVSDFAERVYFCLHGSAGVPMRLNFMNAGQSAYPKG